MHRKMQMTNDPQRHTNPPMLLRNQTRGSTPRQGQVSHMKKMMVAAYLVGVLMTPSVRAQADQQTANWLGSMKARIDILHFAAARETGRTRGAAQQVEDMISAAVERGLHALGQADIQAQARAALEGLAHAATRRVS